MDLTSQELVDLTLQAMKEVYAEQGGPTNYLEKTYDTPEKKLAFSQKLYAYFPPKDHVAMKFDPDWPA